MSQTSDKTVTKSELDAAIAAHHRFLAQLSHELRTPLNALIGFAQLLLKETGDQLDSRHLTYLERMKDNGDLLLNLVKEIEDLSDLQSGKTEVISIPITWSSFLANELAPFQERAQAKGLACKLEYPEHILPLETDPDKLRMILRYLLDNAIKFTSQGHICLRVNTAPDGQPLNLEVEDTGLGIPTDKHEAVFEAFVYLDTIKTHQGSGLGLAMARSLSQTLGYQLTLENNPNGGSCFRLVFQT